MKIRRYLITLCIQIILIKLFDCEILKNKPQNDKSAVFKVLNDIIDYFYTKKNQVFNILIIGHEGDRDSILSSLMVSNNQSFSYKLTVIDNIMESNDIELFDQAFIILPSLLDLSMLNKLHKLILYQFKLLKFVVYIEDLISISELLSLYTEGVDMFTRRIDLYEYFVFDDGDTISFTTVEWYSDITCNIPYISTINQFSKRLMKWKKELKYHEKFMNYHGCELVMMLPADNFVWNFASYNPKLNEFEACGIVPNMFHTMADNFNFQDAYQPAKISGIKKFFDTRRMDLIHVKGKYKIPDVYFDVLQFKSYNGYLHTTSTFIENRVKFLVTPGESYTIYEKLILPFDLITWISLIITFSVSFVIVYVINTYSARVQDLFYGEGIRTPSLNIMSTFFGIPQYALPLQNFPRILLIIFIGYCLIIRTCYQSKLFEFMTTLLRRPPPETITDLFLRNYTIYFSGLNEEFYQKMFDSESWPLLQKIEYDEYNRIYTNESQNGTIKASLLVQEVYQRIDEVFLKQNLHWLELKHDSLYVAQLGFTYFGNVFFASALQKAVEAFIDTGVMQYLYNANYPSRKFSQHIEAPSVLTISDLAFGFNIWFGACCIAVSAFIIELMMLICNAQFRKSYRNQKQKVSIELSNCQRVHPTLAGTSIEDSSIKMETLKKFRVLVSKK